MKRDIDGIIAALTLEEKASLCSGKDFWTTKAVERLGILSWMMTDGPHGLRKQGTDSDHLGLNNSVPATCFPSGAGLAATWNRELLEDVGKALGREAKAEGVGVILGPAVNIKRSPLCGRNFEYYSEDPYLAGELAKHHIRGVQSQGVGASLKHFAVNNQESNRMVVDAVVDERSLREIYLPAFETAVKEAQPWTVMCSYNKINGSYSSENPWLLTTLLREEWGHEGIVVTDWGACDDRVAGLAAGQDLEMPGSGGLNDAEIVAAVRGGTLDEAKLDRAVRRNLELTFKVLDNRDTCARVDTGANYDHDAHYRLARKVAAESMVLLKNEAGTLPLARQARIAFIGAFARTPHHQGGGSSHINPTGMDDAFEEAVKLVGVDSRITYAPGYSLKGGDPDQALLDEAKKTAAGADVAVLFIGLTDDIESEGFDRKDMRLPAAHDALVEAMLEVQKNVVVVLSNGSPVEMPWIDRVSAVLEGYLGGQAWGGAVADLLFGYLSPSGKLAETFPRRLEDNPSFLNFPGEPKRVEYREGLYVGYRYYDAASVKPLFPFGHGLSYSSFEYSELSVDKSDIHDTETIHLSLNVKNTGSVEAKEIVQVYVGDLKASVQRPLRELKAFTKVHLAPGETRTVEFELGKRAFAYWSPVHGDWVVETGEFVLAVGASSRDLRLRAVIRIESSAEDKRVWDLNSCLGDLAGNPWAADRGLALTKQLASAFGSYEPGSPTAKMMEAMVAELPIRAIVSLSGGKIPKASMQAFLDDLNGKAR